ncbi:putative fucolectin-1-like, partial [Triplophysa rosa]
TLALLAPCSLTTEPQESLCNTYNLASNGTTTQSSTYSTWAAQHAIDGKRYGPDASTHCTSTSAERNSWWRLDLLNIYNISTVIITARSDGYLAETNGAEIRIGNSLENNGNNNPICAVTPDPLPDNTVSLSCGVMEGRYVNVILSGRTSHLTLCEVEIYETENLASKGTATQSSIYRTWLAQHAIDGKRYGDAYCAGTSSNSDPWWRLDLLNVYNISTVIITAHDNYMGEASGAEIRIGNSLVNNGNNNPICAVISKPLTDNTVTYSCHGMEGRYVNVVMTGQTYALTLCEVEVYATGKFHNSEFSKLF